MLLDALIPCALLWHRMIGQDSRLFQRRVVPFHIAIWASAYILAQGPLRINVYCTGASRLEDQISASACADRGLMIHLNFSG